MYKKLLVAAFLLIPSLAFGQQVVDKAEYGKHNILSVPEENVIMASWMPTVPIKFDIVAKSNFVYTHTFKEPVVVNVVYTTPETAQGTFKTISFLVELDGKVTPDPVVPDPNGPQPPPQPVEPLSWLLDFKKAVQAEFNKVGIVKEDMEESIACINKYSAEPGTFKETADKIRACRMEALSLTGMFEWSGFDSRVSELLTELKAKGVNLDENKTLILKAYTEAIQARVNAAAKPLPTVVRGSIPVPSLGHWEDQKVCRNGVCTIEPVWVPAK